MAVSRALPGHFLFSAVYSRLLEARGLAELDLELGFFNLLKAAAL